MSGRYNLVKEFIVKPIKKAFKEKSSGKVIKKIDPKVNKTDLEKAKSRLEIQKHKTKMSGAKLDQTRFEIENPKVSKGKYTFDPSKRNVTKKSIENRNKKSQEMFKASKGRKELKFGGGADKKLSPKQMKIASLAGDKKKIDAPDFAKLRKK